MNAVHSLFFSASHLIALAILTQNSLLVAMTPGPELLSPTSTVTPDTHTYAKYTLHTELASELPRLEDIIKAIHSPDASDTEIAALCDLLDKIAQEKRLQLDSTEQKISPEQEYALDNVLGLTPLHQAVRDNNEQEVTALLKEGANPDLPGVYFPFTPRQMAAEEPMSPAHQLVLTWPPVSPIPECE